MIEEEKCDTKKTNIEYYKADIAAFVNRDDEPTHYVEKKGRIQKQIEKESSKKGHVSSKKQNPISSLISTVKEEVTKVLKHDKPAHLKLESQEKTNFTNVKRL